jgi:glucosamine kinase
VHVFFRQLDALTNAPHVEPSQDGCQRGVSRLHAASPQSTKSRYVELHLRNDDKSDPMSNAAFVLGIDAGGTSSKARLCDARGAALASASAGAGSLRFGAAHVFAVISEIAHDAARLAGLSNDALLSTRVVAGVPGLSLESEAAALRAMPHPFAALEIVSDADIACIGAHAGQDGAIVIAGTGSIGLARLAGETIRIGGYGYPISDEGSGADIGLQALKLFLQTDDGRRERTTLSNQLAAVVERRGVHWWRDQAKPKDYAAFAPLVLNAAGAGDAQAKHILQHAGAELSKIALALCANRHLRWCFMGGLSQPLAPFLSAEASALRVAPKGDAIDGALRLGLQHFSNLLRS